MRLFAWGLRCNPAMVRCSSCKRATTCSTCTTNRTFLVRPQTKETKIADQHVSAEETPVHLNCLQRVLHSSLIILVKQTTAATIVLLSTGLQKGKSELYHLDNSLHQDWRRLWIHLYFASRNKLTQLFRAAFFTAPKNSSKTPCTKNHIKSSKGSKDRLQLPSITGLSQRRLSTHSFLHICTKRKKERKKERKKKSSSSTSLSLSHAETLLN